MTATSLTDLTMVEARKGLDNKEFSAAELTDAYITAMEQGRALNAYITETADKAREDAKRADANIASGNAGAHQHIQDYRATVALQLQHVFAGKGMGRREGNDQPLINGLTAGIPESGEMRHSRGQ